MEDELFETAHWRIDVDEDEPERGPFWRGAGAGDKDESVFDHGQPLIMDPRHWPPGTTIVVSEPEAAEFYAKLYGQEIGPLNAEWLLSVGFVERRATCLDYKLGPFRWALRPMKEGEFGFHDSCGVPLAVMQSRQDVRDLCEALGSPLAETHGTQIR